MPRSHAENSKRAAARIQRLCCLGVGCEMLMPDLMEEITTFVPARGGGFEWLERSARWRDHREDRDGDPYIGPTSELTNYYHNLWPQPIARLHFRESRGTPRENDLFRPFNEISAFPTSSAVIPFAHHLRGDRREYRRTDYYNAIWRPVGIDDVLILGVRPPGQKFGVGRNGSAEGGCGGASGQLDVSFPVGVPYARTRYDKRGIHSHVLRRGSTKGCSLSDPPEFR
jgi:hypothetical protein